MTTPLALQIVVTPQAKVTFDAPTPRDGQTLILAGPEGGANVGGVMSSQGGAPLEGQPVTFASSAGGVEFNPATVTTDGNGAFQTLMTIGQSGEVSYSINYEGASFAAPVAVTVLGDLNLAVTAVTTPLIAGVVGTMDVKLTDQTGNPVANEKITFADVPNVTIASASGDGVFTTDSHGIAQAQISSSVAGTYTLTASHSSNKVASVSETVTVVANDCGN